MRTVSPKMIEADKSACLQSLQTHIAMARHAYWQNRSVYSSVFKTRMHPPLLTDDGDRSLVGETQQVIR